MIWRNILEIREINYLSISLVLIYTVNDTNLLSKWLHELFCKWNCVLPWFHEKSKWLILNANACMKIRNNLEIYLLFLRKITLTTESLVDVMKYSPWPGATSKLVTVLCFPRTMFLISVPSMTSQYESCPSVAKVSIWHSLGWSLAHTKDEVQDNVILFFKLSKLERFRVWLSITFRK